MSHAPILYFFPGHLDIPEEYSDRFEPGKVTFALSSPGPGTERGLLISPYPSILTAYLPGEQRWERIGEKAYIGVRKDINPEDLLKEKTLNGYKIELADGKQWIIPVVNTNSENCNIPIIWRWKWSETEKKKVSYSHIIDEYIELTDLAKDISTKIEDSLMAALNGTAPEIELDMSDDEALNLLCDSIAINYEVNLDILSVIGVFSQASFEAALSSLVDLPYIENSVASRYKKLQEKAIFKSTSGGE